MNKHSFAWLTTISLLLGAPASLAAESYPTKPIRVIVAYAPGGGNDVTARILAAHLGQTLGVTLVVDNRPGATGIIGTELVSRAPANGYTVILADAPHAINPYVFPPAPGAVPLVRGGKLRALAVAAAKRSPAIPEVPTFEESGVANFRVDNWYGVLAPARTSKPVIARLNQAIVEATQNPTVRGRFAAVLLDPAGSTPAQFVELLKSEAARWSQLIKTAGIKPD